MSHYQTIDVARYIVEGFADNLTATAGGGQSGALQLYNEINRLTTVATAGDSAALPPSQPGLTIIVINSGANPAQIYGGGTDTINDVATATGVSQIANSVAEYVCAGPGKWYTADQGVGFSASFMVESATEGITAHAGGGQGAATPLTSILNRVTVVASAGDSVALPASAPGLDLIVINHGAKTMQVYGLGTDQIDDVASGTGVAQMVGSVCIYACTTLGKWYSNGIGTGFSGSFPTVSFADALTALAGGGQAGATPITTVLARFTIVASANDSALLPVSAGGMQVTVINAHASNSMNVFPQTGDKVNALAANAAFAVAAGKTATFYCTVAGQWHTILSA